MVIVGGGVTGAALLAELPDAVLIEASEDLAAGASGRNAGFLLAGVASCYADAVGAYGSSLAAEIWAFTIENRERWFNWLGGAAEVRRRGSWTVAVNAAEADRLQESAALLAENGFEAEWYPHPGGLESFQGALLNPRDGELNPALAVGALAAGAEDRIVLGARVDAIESGAGRVRLRVGESSVVCEQVVLATNAWTSLLLPSVPITPVRAQMLATTPTTVPLVYRPAYADRGYQYWRQRADGRVLVGGYRNRALAAENTADASPTPEVQQHLDGHLALIGAAGLPVTHRWAGTMGFTPDGLPLVGAAPGLPGVWLCGGYSGHGLGFALESARRLAAHLQGGPAPPSWLDPGRAGNEVAWPGGPQAGGPESLGFTRP